jgi:hypothetical protein
MSLSVVEGGSKIKLTSGWKEFKFFLVVQLSRATALSQLPNFAVNEIACGGKQISRIKLIFPCLFLLYMRDFLLWAVFAPILYLASPIYLALVPYRGCPAKRITWRPWHLGTWVALIRGSLP